MNKLKLYMLAAILVVGTPLTVYAQGAKVFTLNTINSEQAEKTKQSNFETTYFSLNEDVFTQPEFDEGAEFEFYMNSTSSFRLIVNKKIEYLPGVTSIIASHKGESENVFIATYSNGRLIGMYHPSNEKTFRIGYLPEAGEQYLSDNIQNEILACGIDEKDHQYLAIPHTIPGKKKSKGKAAKAELEYTPAPMNASVDDSITIDLMLVYTDAAETWASTSDQGDIDGVIAQAMALSQAALDNSNLGIELRLVHIHKTSYDEESDGLLESNDRLSRLTQNPNNPVFDSSEGHDGYMEEVHDLRIQYGADVVSLLLKIDDTGGLGWRLNSTSGSPHFAFNLNRVQQVATGYTLIHEIGHNMGNAHSRTQENSAAEISGGLFHYSVGYQNMSANFHTVMAYADGLDQGPLFSSPDLSFNGGVAGTNNNQTPENNARSMKEIKRTIASYLATIESAPETGVSDNSITVEMNREDELPVHFEISNSGESSLVWDIDFDFPGQTVDKAKSTKKLSEKRMEPEALENPVQYAANYVQPERRTKSLFTEEVIYATSFENNEGFNTGSFEGMSDWRTLTNSEFKISTVNPNSGSQHLRLEYDGETNDSGDPVTQFFSAPFFGYQTFGEYEITINFEVGGTNYQNQPFDFYIFDGKTGGWSSGVIIANGTIFFADLNEDNELSFSCTACTDIESDVYYTLKIRYNPTEEAIEYYLNGTLIESNSYLEGNTPGVMRVLHRNSVIGTYMNVDDIEIKRLNSPYPWLSANETSGVTFEGENSEVSLNFSTKDVSAGTYETIMRVTTNDPVNRVLEIPITLEVNNVVSNETENIPEKIALLQNYPNPFNPSTVISYRLADPSEVKLEVFNMTGRKVATLVNNRKTAGEHRVEFDASDLASGIYIYRLKTAGQTLTRKMVLIK